MSGGERQRLALARALARDPSVLLLDEPFAAIDRAIRRELQASLDDIRRTLDIPVILVTHDFDDVVRLATDVLLLERGHRVASGPIEKVLAQPDLAWLGQAVGLGSVFDATVAAIDADRGLATLTFDGGTLIASTTNAPVGTSVRVRIPAREIILATHAPEGLSLHNIWAGDVTAVHRDLATNRAVVQILVGQTRLLAEVTPDAVTKLGIAPGLAVYALIKSVAIEVVR
jgi:molybdate transport system ATP-binding protein